MQRWALRAIYAFDQLRFAVFRTRWRGSLHAAAGVSPNLRLADLRIEPGGSVELGPGFATERRRGNRIWVQSGGTLSLGPRVWLRTEHGENQLTCFPSGRMQIGADVLLNGAMLHAKCQISIGASSSIGFGVRIFDADLHDLDRETPERMEPVRIGERVWLGADVIVLRGVSIGDDTVVGAGSVVTRDLPAQVLAAGVPARVLRRIADRTGCR